MEDYDLKFVPKNHFGGYSVAVLVKNTPAGPYAKLDEQANDIHDLFSLLGVEERPFPVWIGLVTVNECEKKYLFTVTEHGLERIMNMKEVATFLEDHGFVKV